MSRLHFKLIHGACENDYQVCGLKNILNSDLDVPKTLGFMT